MENNYNKRNPYSKMGRSRTGDKPKKIYAHKVEATLPVTAKKKATAEKTISLLVQEITSKVKVRRSNRRRFSEQNATWYRRERTIHLANLICRNLECVLAHLKARSQKQFGSSLLCVYIVRNTRLPNSKSSKQRFQTFMAWQTVFTFKEYIVLIKRQS